MIAASLGSVVIGCVVVAAIIFFIGFLVIGVGNLINQYPIKWRPWRRKNG